MSAQRLTAYHALYATSLSKLTLCLEPHLHTGTVRPPKQTPTLSCHCQGHSQQASLLVAPVPSVFKPTPQEVQLYTGSSPS